MRNSARECMATLLECVKSKPGNWMLRRCQGGYTLNHGFPDTYSHT